MSYEIVFNGDNAKAAVLHKMLLDAGIGSIVGTSQKYLGIAEEKSKFGFGEWIVLAPSTDLEKAKEITSKFIS